jgi:hypothetical protein
MLHWDTHPSATPCHSPMNPQPLGSSPLGCTRPQLQAGPTPYRDTHPSSPPPLRPCWGPGMHGTTRTLSLGLPAPQALPASSSVWNDWSPTQPGQAPAWHETAASTNLPGFPALRQSWAPALHAFQITAPPGSHSGAIRGLQVCLRDTHRQDWTIKE